MKYLPVAANDKAPVNVAKIRKILDAKSVKERSVSSHNNYREEQEIVDNSRYSEQKNLNFRQ
jgi:hypothetical protein